jgi:hypothetical protein
MRGRMVGMSHEPPPPATRLPRVEMDWTTNSLDNYWTKVDLKRQGLELYDGMRCVFYQLDAEDGHNGFLHDVGVVFWDKQANKFRVRTAPGDLRFTPGDNLCVLDAEYP